VIEAEVEIGVENRPADVPGGYPEQTLAQNAHNTQNSVSGGSGHDSAYCAHSAYEVGPRSEPPVGVAERAPAEPVESLARNAHNTQNSDPVGGGVHSPPQHQLVNEAALVPLAAAIREAQGPVALDTETTGLDPARDRVRLLQLAVGDAVFLVDLFAFPDPRAALAPVLAALASKEVVGHNVTAFDLPFLARLGFAPERVFDTALASRVAYAGESADHDLASVVRRELGRELDKAAQRSDWSAPVLTPTQLAYAAADVAVLLPLAAALRARAADRGVTPVADLEMACAVPVARMAARGVGFDPDPWAALADAAADRKRALVAEMNALAPNPACLPGMEGWNWDSTTADVPRAFAALGITLDDTKEETLAGVDHPLARALLEYRGASKRANTYGRTWADAHVTDGRVYATWNPCQAKTGRMSCSRPNLQQVPRDAAYRRCFVARAGHVLVKCDFSQIELRIAAKVTGDTRMLAAYRSGEDLHALTAARFLGVAPDAVTKEARQMAKPVNFGAIYGLGPRSLRLKARAEYGKDMTEAEAKGFLDAFFREFAGVRVWHNRLKRQRATEVRTLGGRRVVVEPDQFHGAKANYVIQGTGGDGLKRALVLLWDRRAECPHAEPVLAVHDEVVLEVPKAGAERAKAWLERCMVDAMAPLIDPVPVEVESTVGRTWGG
jgi:DNA polymerase-1